MSCVRATKIVVFVVLCVLPLPSFALRTWSSLLAGNLSAANVLDIHRQKQSDISGEGRETVLVKDMGRLLFSNQQNLDQNSNHNQPTEQSPLKELSISWLQNGSWNPRPESVIHREKSLDTNDGYQSDFTGHGSKTKAYISPPGPDGHTVERWLSMRPMVECAGNAMTLTAQGRGYTNLLVDREGSSPVSLFHLPPHCGYNMKYTWKDLVLKVPYDGCYITRENGSYVLPLLWRGRPVKISCPVVAVPELLCSPYGMLLKVTTAEDGEHNLKARVEGRQVPLLSRECAQRLDDEQLLLFTPHTAACVTVKDDQSTIAIVIGGTEFTMACPLHLAPPLSHIFDPLSSPSLSHVQPDKLGLEGPPLPHPPPHMQTTQTSVPIRPAVFFPGPNPPALPLYPPGGPQYILHPDKKFPEYAHVQPYPQQEHSLPQVPPALIPSSSVSPSGSEEIPQPQVQLYYNPYVSVLHPHVGQKFPAPSHPQQQVHPLTAPTPSPPSPLTPPVAHTPGSAETPGSAGGAFYGPLLSYPYPYMGQKLPGHFHTAQESQSPQAPTSPHGHMFPIPFHTQQMPVPVPAASSSGKTPDSPVWSYSPLMPFPHPHMEQQLPTNLHTQQQTGPFPEPALYLPVSSKKPASDSQPGPEKTPSSPNEPHGGYFIPYPHPHVGLKFPFHPYPEQEAPSVPVPMPSSAPQSPPSKTAPDSQSQLPLSPGGGYSHIMPYPYFHMGQKFPAHPGPNQQEAHPPPISSSASGPDLEQTSILPLGPHQGPFLPFYHPYGGKVLPPHLPSKQEGKPDPVPTQPAPKVPPTETHQASKHPEGSQHHQGYLAPYLYHKPDPVPTQPVPKVPPTETHQASKHPEGSQHHQGYLVPYLYHFAGQVAPPHQPTPEPPSPQTPRIPEFPHHPPKMPYVYPPNLLVDLHPPLHHHPHQLPSLPAAPPPQAQKPGLPWLPHAHPQAPGAPAGEPSKDGPMLYYPPYQAPFPVPVCPPNSPLTCAGYPNVYPHFDVLASTTTTAPVSSTSEPSKVMAASTATGQYSAAPSDAQKPGDSKGSGPESSSADAAAPPNWSPSLSCMMNRLVVSLPTANPDSIQLREAKDTWVAVGSAHPHCQYDVRPGVRGMLLSTRLPACHSRRTEDPYILSLPVRFWDGMLGRYRYLDLRCPFIHPLPTTTTTVTPTTTVTVPPTTPTTTVTVPPTTPTTTVTVPPTTPTTTTGQLTPIPTFFPPLPPKPELLCSTHHMTVALPPGPVSALVLKDLEGNEMKVEDAPVHCGYNMRVGKSGHITIILPYNSCHVKVKENRHTVELKFELFDGRKGQAKLSCPLPTPPSGPDCNVPSEQQIACAPGPVSASQCHLLGCCHRPTTRACYYPMDECTGDGHFVFIVPSTIISPPLNPALLVAGGNMSCTPLRATHEYALFKIPLDGCGAHKFEVGQTVIYMVEILNTVQAISLTYGTITRDSPVRVLVECRYLPGSVVSVGYLVKRPSLGPSIQAQGVFGVQLRIATDPTYTSYHPQYHRPLSLLLGRPLYLEVRLLNPPDPSVVLLVHYCVAYPRSAQSAWVLIYDGCPNPLDPAPSVTPTPPTPEVPSQTRRFSVSSFQFLTNGDGTKTTDPSHSDEEIYFMCSTEVCSPSDGPCVEGCFNPSKG